jgi:hypothetical protein
MLLDKYILLQEGFWEKLNDLKQELARKCRSSQSVRKVHIDQTMRLKNSLNEKIQEDM